MKGTLFRDKVSLKFDSIQVDFFFGGPKLRADCCFRLNCFTTFENRPTFFG